ncbi:hypothetical protein [Mesorhizobium sp. M0678]|uniref:hypothetical protein n=1 Tax=Mesorhizobium sp. M0678 TaxID=2956985 RepID=UPI00333CF55A
MSLVDIQSRSCGCGHPSGRIDDVQFDVASSALVHNWTLFSTWSVLDRVASSILQWHEDKRDKWHHIAPENASFSFATFSIDSPAAS